MFSLDIYNSPEVSSSSSALLRMILNNNLQILILMIKCSLPITFELSVGIYVGP